MKRKFSIQIKPDALLICLMVALIVGTVTDLNPAVCIIGALLLGFIMTFVPMPVGSFFMPLTAGLTKACEARSGGLVKVYLANKHDITSFTLAGGVYSAVTMVSGKVFYKFEFMQDSAMRKNVTTRENGSIKVEHLIEFYIEKLTQGNRDRLQEIADASTCGMVAICEDANGIKWVEGYSEAFLLERPLYLQTDESDSGKNFTDPNGSTVTISGVDKSKAMTFTGTVPV